MRRRLFLIVSIILFACPLTGSASAFWLWSPKTLKYINPKKVSKPVPKNQFQYALSFYAAKNYSRALDEMKNLVRDYPRATEAGEAYFYMGLCQEELEDYDAAYKSYEEVVKKYPNSGRIQDIIEREYRIANLFYNGKKRKIAGLEIFPSFDKAIEIYRRVVENAPYGPYADLSQYKTGECFKKKGEYGESREAFEKLIETYQKSELIDDAKYQIALVTFKMSGGAHYDERETDEAIEKFSNFIKEHPESNLVKESGEAIQELRNRKAEKAFDIAEFYAKQGAIPAAKTYYNEVVEHYAESSWARLALERLTILEKEAKK